MRRGWEGLVNKSPSQYKATLVLDLAEIRITSTVIVTYLRIVLLTQATPEILTQRLAFYFRIRPNGSI
jgi:hypothetical protein